MIAPKLNGAKIEVALPMGVPGISAGSPNPAPMRSMGDGVLVEFASAVDSVPTHDISTRAWSSQ